MAKTWILDTETKGTGANVVPLEKLEAKPERSQDVLYVPRKRGPRPAKPPEPKPARTFKVVDVVSRRVLAEGVDALQTVRVLEDVRSIVDVNVYVWQPIREKWRMLGLDERRQLWDFRGA